MMRSVHTFAIRFKQFTTKPAAAVLKKSPKPKLWGRIKGDR